MQELTVTAGSGAKAALSRKAGEGADTLYIGIPYAGAYGMGEKYNGVNQKGKTAVNR